MRFRQMTSLFGKYCSVFVPLLFLVGCGDGAKLVKVDGTVTMEKAPLASATIQLIPSNGDSLGGAVGTSDEQGKFTVSSLRSSAQEGVSPGAYTVRVSKMMNKDGTVLPPDAMQADYPDAFEAIPAPYSTLESTLQVTVSEAGGAITVDVPSKLLKKR